MKAKFNKTIAILGGSGPWASAYTHQEVVRLAQWDYGAVQDAEYPDIIHISRAIEGFGAKGIEQEDRIEEQLRSIFDAFNALNADIVIIACNSLHRYYDKMVAYSGMEIVSLPQEGANRLKGLGIAKAAVLCSESALRDRLHATELQKLGIEAILPDERQQERVSQMIETIMAGSETTATYSDFRKLSREFAAKGAQSVLSGCTELSWLANKAQPDVPVVDCLNAAVVKALKLSAQPA